MPQRFKFLFADETNIYGVKDTGELLQWSSSATSLLPVSTTDATALGVAGVGGTQIGSGFADFVHLFAGGGGILYAVRATGELLMYKYAGGSWVYTAVQVSGPGWAQFLHLQSNRAGGIFAVRPDGALVYYNHTGWSGSPPTNSWDNGGVAQVVGSPFYVPFFCFGLLDAQSYMNFWAVFPDGTLRCYSTPSPLTMPVQWSNGGVGVTCNVSGAPMVPSAADPNSTTQWGMFTHVFSDGKGALYGVTCEEFGQVLYKFTWSASPPTLTATRLSPAYAQTMQFGWQCIPVEGFAWPMSGAPGDTLHFQASTSVPAPFQVTFGALASAGALLPRTAARGYGVTSLSYAPQPAPPTTQFQVTAPGVSATGCAWNDSFVLAVPPTSLWPSGYYVARCTTPTGYTYDIPFIVKPDPALLSGGGRPGDIAVLANVNTWNSYNTWGGYSNYNGGNGKTLSYRRPDHHLLTAFTDHGSGTHLLRGEIWVFEWLRQTYPSRQVHVYTDIDLHDDGSFLNAYKCVVIQTHPEYWSAAECQKLDAYVHNGGHIVYLGGNAAYRQTVMSPSTGAMTTTGQDGPSPDATNRILLGITIGPYGSTPSSYTVSSSQSTDPAFAGITGSTFGTSGWNNAASNNTAGLAAAWETEWAGGGSSEQVALASAGANGSMARYTPANGNGGWAVGFGSLTVGGSLRSDANLQIIVKNLLGAAGVNP